MNRQQKRNYIRNLQEERKKWYREENKKPEAAIERYARNPLHYSRIINIENELMADGYALTENFTTIFAEKLKSVPIEKRKEIIDTIMLTVKKSK